MLSIELIPPLFTILLVSNKCAVLHASTIDNTIDESIFSEITSKYESWLISSADTQYTDSSQTQVRWTDLYNTGVRANKTLFDNYMKSWEDETNDPKPYDTRNVRSDDVAELKYLLTYALPDLSLAYRLGHSSVKSNNLFNNSMILERVESVFTRLYDRGFRSGMLMPVHKSEVVDEELDDKAIVVDFYLRLSGFAYATFLMRDALNSTIYLNCLETCAYIMTKGKKLGDAKNLHLNADGIRVAANFALPYALATKNSTGLRLYRDQVIYSMEEESNVFDTIKPDGIGFHHYGAYMAAYTPYAVQDAAFSCWLFHSLNDLTCPNITINSLFKNMDVLQKVSHKYDMHKALAGRTMNWTVIPHVVLGYAYLASLPHEHETESQKTFLRLVNDTIFDDPSLTRLSGAFSGIRDTNPPGPGAVHFFFSLVSSLKEVHEGGVAPPSGHWSFNYGPLSVHRRNNWMASVKGYSKYFWAFERTPTQNVLGFHDSTANLRIHVGDDATYHNSGYAVDGWDWSFVPGGTTRIMNGEQLYKKVKKVNNMSNRPFGDSTFVGGVNLEGNGLFAMNYKDITVDYTEQSFNPKKAPIPFQAEKAFFFFDSEIICITHLINHGNGKDEIGTTLFQSALPKKNTITWVNGKKKKDLKTITFDDEKNVRLVDSVGNGYYIPYADGLEIRRKRQKNRGYTGKTKKRGYFATAWKKHGTGKKAYDDNFLYVILPSAGEEGVANYDPGENFNVVLRTPNVGVIVHHKKLNMVGYAIQKINTEIESGIVSQVSSPCLVMTKTRFGSDGLSNAHLKVSVVNPNLGWTPNGRYKVFQMDEKYNSDFLPKDPVPMPMSLTFHGTYNLVRSFEGVNVTTLDSNQTLIHVNTTDAQVTYFELQCDDVSDCQEIHEDKEVFTS